MKSVLAVLVLSVSFSAIANPISKVVGEAYEKAARAQKTGSVKRTSEFGYRYEIKTNENTKKFNLRKELVSRTISEITLKVDGDTVYSLELDENGKIAAVMIENIPAQRQQIETMLANAAVLGDGTETILFTVEQEGYESYSVTSFNEAGEEVVASVESSTTKIEAQVNIKNILCDSDVQALQSGIVYTSPEGINLLDDVSMRSTSTCGGVLSTKILKKFDLKKVTVCSYEADTGDCKADQDMSHLTQDL